MNIYMFFIIVTEIRTAAGSSEELPPVFKSIGTTIKTIEHETVLLPCYVDNLGTNIHYNCKKYSSILAL